MLLIVISLLIIECVLNVYMLYSNIFNYNVIEFIVRVIYYIVKLIV